MRYYGGKTKLLNFIESVIAELPVGDNPVFFDLFSGTTVVGQHFKKLGYTVYTNDILEFSHSLAKCLIEINERPSFQKLSEDPIIILNRMPIKAGFITKNYSPYNGNPRQYVSTDNAKKIDTIREQIHNWHSSGQINTLESYYLITSLLKGINLVSNVTGTYAAYLKTWDNRALKPLSLQHPDIISSSKNNKAFRADANKIVREHSVDILYLDPPYNSRQYASNYFFLELIAEGWFDKEPDIYGVTGMRPYTHQKSDYSNSKKAARALLDLIDGAKAKYVVLSYNNEGIISHEEIKYILSRRGVVKEFNKDHKRYRAINQDGSNTQTREALFLLELNK